jgi:cystathionine beta-synthase
MADQFYTPANPEAHFRTTGPEIWEQTGGRVTHFVGSAGTGGTITGVGRYLKQQNPQVRVVGVDPEGSFIGPFFNTGERIDGHPYKVEGVGNDKIPGALDLDVVDEYRACSDGDAFRMGRRLTREEGLFVGGSSGLLVHAAVAIARELDDPDALVVTLLPSWGERYLSKMYDDDWMRENGFLERPRRTTIAELIGATERRVGNLISVAPSTSVRMALSTITAHDIGQLPVVIEDECVGSITETRLMARVIDDPGLLDKPVEAVMGPPFPVLDGHVDSEEVVQLMKRGNAACLVRDHGRLTGIVTRYDVVRVLTA